MAEARVTPRRILPAALVVLAAFTILSCASVPKGEPVSLRWPEPPLTTRITFVGLLRNQGDLGRSAGERFVEALLGKRVTDSLSQPMGVIPSRDGKRLYVTDYARPGVYVFDFENRRMSFLGAKGPGFTDPVGVALDDRENIYVVDSTPRMIRVFDPGGRFLRNITHETLERPTGIAIDARRGRIYVADSAHISSGNHVIRVFDLEGNYLREFGGQGSEAGRFLSPTYLALDEQGNLYVADTMNARVQAFDPEGRHIKTFGERGDTFGMFDKPKGVAVDTFGNLYVVDSSWSNVQIFNPRGDVLLFFGGRGRLPGLLFNPTGISIDRDNRIYVADAFNGRVAIYQLINTKAEDSLVTLPPRPEKRPQKGGDPAETIQGTEERDSREGRDPADPAYERR